MESYLEQSLAKLEEFEGSIPWMYLDSSGKVTVGVGLMLPNAAAAMSLPFAVGDRPATRAEIAAEFARVDAMPMGRPAQHYRLPGAPELPRAAIDGLLHNVLEGFDGQLRARIHGYTGFPENVKLALLDMAYNLGPEGLLHGYPNLIQAVQDGSWAEAATASFRHGPGAARNQWTHNMLLSARVASIAAQAEPALKTVCYGLLGAGATVAGWLRRQRAKSGD